MASNHTTHYSLSQWQATDEVVRTDFNADNAKIDAALHGLRTDVDGKLGRAELLREAASTGRQSFVDISLADIDWDETSYLIITSECRKSDAQSIKTHLNLGQTAGSSSASYSDFFETQLRPFALVFLPLRDAGRNVQALAFGVNSGYSVGGCTFRELTAVRFNSDNTLPTDFKPSILVVK